MNQLTTFFANPLAAVRYGWLCVHLVVVASIGSVACWFVPGWRDAFDFEVDVVVREMGKK